MLEFKNVSIQYRGEKPILADVNFKLRDGITALLGRNGAGKSSLLHATLGEVPYTGEILLNGKSIADIPTRERAKMLSLLPQHLPSPALCVRETVALGFAPYSTRLCEKEWQTVCEILNRLQLSHLADRPVSSLSGGERQRVFLGMLLAQSTPVMLFDEPSTYLDAPHHALLCEILQKEREKGKQILLVMHDLTHALSIADRVLVLDENTLVFDGTPDACIDAHVPERIFSLTRYDATDDRGNTVRFFQ